MPEPGMRRAEPAARVAFRIRRVPPLCRRRDRRAEAGRALMIRRIALGVGIWLALELGAGLVLALVAPRWIMQQLDTLAACAR